MKFDFIDPLLLISSVSANNIFYSRFRDDDSGGKSSFFQKEGKNGGAGNVSNKKAIDQSFRQKILQFPTQFPSPNPSESPSESTPSPTTNPTMTPTHGATPAPTDPTAVP
mmetsp:Transcript_10117/g.15530  ORF Transcript_10117/g.15530 Transcript_10117/m.15530 type:complete len:110 (-) Transcript_10117:379-708(-)